MKTYSTVEVARNLGIGRQTLHRWIREGSVPAPRLKRLGNVSIRIWTARDIEVVRKYKATHYRKGRGRKKKLKA